MKKAADLQDMVQRAGSTISSGAQNAGSTIMDWYNKMDPSAKHAILSGLVGAGLGGAAAGGMAAATPGDPEERHHIAGPAGIGALLGGIAGAGMPYGAKLLSGSPLGTDHRSIVDKAQGAARSTFLGHPLMAAGAGLGMYGMLRKGGKPAVAAMNAIRQELAAMPIAPGASRVQQILRGLKAYGKAIPNSLVGAPKGTRTGLLGVPVGAGVGAWADKYLQGEQ